LEKMIYHPNHSVRRLAIVTFSKFIETANSDTIQALSRGLQQSKGSYGEKGSLIRTLEAIWEEPHLKEYATKRGGSPPPVSYGNFWIRAKPPSDRAVSEATFSTPNPPQAVPSRGARTAWPKSPRLSAKAVSELLKPPPTGVELEREATLLRSDWNSVA